MITEDQIRDVLFGVLSPLELVPWADLRWDQVHSNDRVDVWSAPGDAGGRWTFHVARGEPVEIAVRREAEFIPRSHPGYLTWTTQLAAIALANPREVTGSDPRWYWGNPEARKIGRFPF